MPGTFAIATTSTGATLDAARRGRASFTVANTSGRALRGRARIVPANPDAAPWLALDGPAEQAFPLAGTQQYTVLIAVPVAAPAGSYAFRIDVIGVDNPDDEYAGGPSVTFTVPAATPAPKPFPWWIAGVAAAVLLIAGGLGVFLVGQSNSQNAAATARFDGDWLIGVGNLRLHHNGAGVQGEVYGDSPNQQNGTVQGTVAGNTLTGQWTLADQTTRSFSMTADSLNTTLFGVHPFCGARGNAPFPANCSFAGQWASTLNGVACPITLTLAAGAATGPVCGYRNAGGSLSYPAPSTVLLQGSTGDGQTHVDYRLFLSADATQFQGVAQVTISFPAGGSQTRTVPWCGARAGAQPPAPCLRSQ